MSTRQKLRSEETKQAILSAATRKFSEQGFHAVTMRQIAKEAGCSHTAIYIYFKDKIELLHELSMPLLTELKQRYDRIAARQEQLPESRLREMSMAYIQFCLLNPTMYTTFFIAMGSSVDAEPKLAVNKLRFDLFACMGHELQTCLSLEERDDRMLGFQRIYFYMLQGIASTYASSGEPFHQLMERLGATFEEAFAALIAGFKLQIATGGR